MVRRAGVIAAWAASSIAGAACDSGSSIDAVDWSSFEARLTALEEENADLRAQLGTAVLEADLAAYAKTEDLAGYATNADVAACALDSDLAAYAKTEDLAAYAKTEDLAAYAKTEDLAGYATDADVAACALDSDLAAYAKTEDLAAYAKTTDLAAYAKTTDLAAYAKTTDLAAYAKTTDLAAYAKTTDLAAYAKTTDLAAYAKTADLAPYARTEDLPDFDLFATVADVTALDTRLDEDLDPLTTDALRVIRDDLVIDIPEDFATFGEAMTWADGYSIAQGHTLTFRFAPSPEPYVFDAPLIASGHRDGGRIHILGDVTDASKVVLEFPQSSAISLRHGRIGLIDGITFRGGYDHQDPASTPAPSDPPPSGISASMNASITLGDEVVVEGFWRSGLRALYNGAISAEGVVSRYNGEDGFAAIDGGFIYAPDAVAQGNARHGFNAAINGGIDALRLTATGNGQVGVNAFMGSAVASNNGTSGVGGFATSTDNGWHGFSATGASGMSIPYAVATGNGKVLPALGFGVIASNGGAIDANHAQAKSNAAGGFGSVVGGALNAQFSVSEANKQSGYLSHNASAIDALATTASMNDQSGFAASLGGSIQANRFGGTPAQQSVARQNKQNGFASFTGGAIDATLALSEDNLGAGIVSNGNSIVTASGVTVDGNNGDGLTSWMGGAIIATPAFLLGQPVPTSVKDTGGNAVAANMGSTIVVDGGVFVVRPGSGGHGVTAWQSSTVSAQSTTLAGYSSSPFNAWLGSTVNANNSHAADSNQPCFNAQLGASISADNSSASRCAGGYNAWTGGSIHAMGARSEGATNGQPGFHVHGNSTLNGALLSAVGGTGNGFDVTMGSAVWAPGLEADANDGYGVSVGSTSNLLSHAWTVGVDPDDVTYVPTITDNAGGVSVHDGSYVSLPDALVTGSEVWDGVHVNGHSGLTLSGGAISGGTGNANAAGVHNLSWLNAQHVDITGNTGGVHCAGSSACDLQSATVVGNAAGIGAVWNAFVMVYNVYAAGNGVDYDPTPTGDEFESGLFGAPRFEP
ncbi:MAG: hypothetical protein IT385_23690 [Deltaproteobacteria bacterium]|nr:hypothetical protein [Deltaproteobacteria bacterium]